MSIVTVSPKFQMVIPKEIRESLGIAPGEKLEVVQFEDRIELIPLKKLKNMRGFLKGMDTKVEREAD